MATRPSPTGSDEALIADRAPMRQEARAETGGSGAGHALVLGGLDIAGPLADAGVPVTMMRPREEPSRFSRSGIPWIDQLTATPTPATMVSAAETLTGPVVLYPADDQMLRFVSEHRAELSSALSFLLPSAEVVDTLLDKGRFQDLAHRRGLPVPPSEVVATTGDSRAARGLGLPVVVKPLVWRAERLSTDFGDGKALIATTTPELQAVLERVAHSYEHVLVQRFVPGDETRVESYHGYVDPEGEVAAEFTGRKVRTSPARFGQSTAVYTTDEPDVIELGRRVVREAGVQGVAKVDFKRDPDGKLWLFEVNARFNLWHRVGASAGCNIPVLVFDDLTGRPRAPYTRGRPGVAWCRQPRDAIEARHQGVPLPYYLQWLRRCDEVAGLRITDPMPFLRGSVPIQLRGAVQRAMIRRGRGT